MKKSFSQTEDKIKTILETIEDGYYELDLAGNFTFFNDALCRMHGRSEEELMGMNFKQYLDEENIKVLFQAYNRVYKTGILHKEFGLPVKRKDGTKIYVKISIFLQKNSSGKPIGFRGIVRDVTERKKAEDKLRESEANYRQLFDNSPAAIYQIDYKNGKFLKANDVFYKYFGCSPEEITSLSPYDILTQESKKLFLERVEKISQGIEVPDIVEFEGFDKKGKRWCLQLKIKNIYDAEGHVVAADVVAHDITERKKMEEMLRKSEEKYRLLAEHIKDMVWLSDLDLKLTYISPSMEKELGYTFEELKHLPLDKLLTSASFNAAMDFFSEETSKALASPQDYDLNRTLELEFICKDGHTGWEECIFGFIRDEDGKPVSILGESRDITERKQMEDEMRESETNFHHSLDESPLGVRISTIEGETIYANRAILDIYGCDSIEELKNTSLKERYTPESYAQWQARKAKRLRGEFGPSEYEISIVTKNGGVRHLYVFRKAIFWNSKKQSQVIYQDITERKQAEEKLSKTLENLRQSIKTTIQVLVMASEAKDPYTAGHQKRVANLARDIAKERGLSHHAIEGIRMAGSIHDIGKLSVPAEILSKPTKLTDIEFSLIKEHSLNGYEMLRHVESPWPLAEIVYQHHERMNGTGYPRNLKEDEISMAARVMAIADVVEAMSSHRPYRASLGVEAALQEIEKNKGILYDADIVDACLRLFRDKGYQLT